MYVSGLWREAVRVVPGLSSCAGTAGYAYVHFQAGLKIVAVLICMCCELTSVSLQGSWTLL